MSFSFNASACLNEYGRTIQGERRFTPWFTIPERARHHNLNQVKIDLSNALSKIDADTTLYQEWSNISVYYMKLGKVDTALKILEPLIKRFPKQYNLIANLGTAYELSGQLDSALKYIKLGYEINPKSHANSEWIHIKILEAKIKEKRSVDWLYSNSILSGKLLKQKLKDSKGGLRSLDRQIKKQILTRLPFTPAPNKVIRNILSSMGRFHQSEGTYESAFLYYAYAYQFEENHYRKQRISHIIERLNIARLSNKKNVKLPMFFTKTLARSRIDPTFLILGLHEFAASEDSLLVGYMNEQDSINILQTKIDSMINNPPKPETIIIEKPIEVIVQKTNWLLSTGIGLLVGIMSILVYKRIKS